LDVYDKMEDVATHIDSGVKALQLSLIDLENNPNPYRLHGARTLADHLQELVGELDVIVSEARDVAKR